MPNVKTGGPLLGFIRIGRVAQAGERLVDIEEVTGSIPVAPTIVIMARFAE